VKASPPPLSKKLKPEFDREYAILAIRKRLTELLPKNWKGGISGF